MIAFNILLGFFSLAAASSAEYNPGYPPTTKSQGFNLVVNVTNLNRDFKPSIHGKYINSIHVGPAFALLGVGSKEDNPRIFYVNGTAEEVHFAHSNVISDAGTPSSPYSISLIKVAGTTPASKLAHLDAGPGQVGIGLTRLSIPYVFLYPETYAICNESIPYYQGARFLVVKQFLSSAPVGDIPKSCVPVRLFPECTKLNELPDGAISSHEFAYEAECYKDVGSIEWPKYKPW